MMGIGNDSRKTLLQLCKKGEELTFHYLELQTMGEKKKLSTRLKFLLKTNQKKYSVGIATNKIHQQLRFAFSASVP